MDSEQIIYLSDLKEISVEYWEYTKNWGFGKNGKYWIPDDGGKDVTIVLAGEESPHGIFCHPTPDGRSNIEYDISKFSANKFQARIGVADSRKCGPHTPLIFEVVGDGEVLWKSKPVKRWGQAQDCEVDVAGVKNLELRVRCPGDASFAMAVWCEPRLIAGGR